MRLPRLSIVTFAQDAPFSAIHTLQTTDDSYTIDGRNMRDR